MPVAHGLGLVASWSATLRVLLSGREPVKLRTVVTWGSAGQLVCSFCDAGQPLRRVEAGRVDRPPR